VGFLIDLFGSFSFLGWISLKDRDFAAGGTAVYGWEMVRLVRQPRLGGDQILKKGSN
jgi:hypothetical protein